MSAMKEMEITIQEVARIALEDNETLSNIARELGLDERDLKEVSRYLESLVGS